MKYLLDTCILINLLKGDTTLQDRIVQIGSENVFVSDIILAEFYVGPNKRGDSFFFRQAEWVEREFECVFFRKSYRTYGRIRAYLEKQGNKLDNMDLLIASTAIDNDLTLVTSNAKHFSRIPGLKLEVWE